MPQHWRHGIDHTGGKGGGVGGHGQGDADMEEEDATDDKTAGNPY